MEVEIKKAKITKSILGQICFATTENLFASKVLGWCIFSGRSRIILYNEEKKLLYQYRFYSKLEVTQTKDGKHTDDYYVAFFEGHNIPDYLKFDTKERAQVYVNRANDVIKKAMELGQFYV